MRDTSRPDTSLIRLPWRHGRGVRRMARSGLPFLLLSPHRARSYRSRRRRNHRADQGRAGGGAGMTDPTAYLRYRVRILPNQLAAARTRVVHLEREAIRYGFIDLLADAPLAGRYDPASIVDSEAVLNSYAAPEWRELDEKDRKRTRLTPVTNAHLVCRLLLEKKKKLKH